MKLIYKNCLISFLYNSFDFFQNLDLAREDFIFFDIKLINQFINQSLFLFFYQFIFLVSTFLHYILIIKIFCAIQFESFDIACSSFYKYPQPLNQQLTYKKKLTSKLFFIFIQFINDKLTKFNQIPNQFPIFSFIHQLSPLTNQLTNQITSSLKNLD
ncbi:transmembrane protein, putative (macronuclear) [Tetrahymena thermophila SB210]|uniref:Transmembrane protein, putative n=1 Tax=Tetrahymena thermophila (strain SB210) TaxID=312017 RepID=W7WZG4_TETTS|nr:transmembrane protein, putative [Tetrahymena thermophila SB210]EWS70992.1 transmembrane protein, putative [Tetrahymena thermophila SB210]|eukprot:XP_012656476.1 transmembrane protein, putative [Tetrahymena thermophila SB210]